MNRVEILDHGYVELIETWGSDERIIESARMSTGKGFLGWGLDHSFHQPTLTDEDHCNHFDKMSEYGPILCGKKREDHGKSGDEKLLRYLWTSDPPHTSPFELAGAVFEIQAPIMVFREWHRHRTQSYNEMSGRYTALPDINYVPTVERALLNSKTNKQAGTIAGADELTKEVAANLLAEEVEFNAAAERFYQKKLKAGFPKELARTHIGVNRYSRMRAQAVLLNWMKFLTLRCAPNAQWEIRQYADVIRDMLTENFPRTMELFKENQK